ncbi:MAG TPA: 2OG-Fe(II) oxygenase [Archangium sp.]|nr:2OG-Fe(II) oxygenase [Archangium sp.]
MKTTFSSPQVVVFDDVLPPEQFQQLWRYMQSVPYKHVHAEGVRGVWRPEDGNPMEGPRTVNLAITPPEEMVEGMMAAYPGTSLYPTHKPIDPLLEAVKALATEHQAMLGQGGEDWLLFSAAPWIYPTGSGLSWHCDDGKLYTGAFIYYAHPEWNVQWGGELLIADESAKGAGKLGDEGGTGPRRQHVFDNKEENEQLLRGNGLGTFIIPRPNRLVFLARDYPHMVAKVSPAAGNRVRASVAGFFIRPEFLFGGGQ